MTGKRTCQWNSETWFINDDRLSMFLSMFILTLRYSESAENTINRPSDPGRWSVSCLKAKLERFRDFSVDLECNLHRRSEDGVSNIVFLFAFLQTSFIVERRGKQLLSGIGGIGGIATVNLVSISYQISRLSRLSIHVWSFFLFVETLPSGKHTKNYGKSP